MFGMIDALTLANIDGDLVPVVAIIGGLFVGATAIIGGVVSSTKRERAREETKREIAAYVAEGSMTPEEGERLIRAGEEGKKCDL